MDYTWTARHEHWSLGARSRLVRSPVSFNFSVSGSKILSCLLLFPVLLSPHSIRKPVFFFSSISRPSSFFLSISLFLLVDIMKFSSQHCRHFHAVCCSRGL
ncbi:hypothetical protein B0T22DRAFT_282514 [Podospora appendiculata]|uniref:Transmembrane protein n=1 Tax=Podospora appendiculata TaxID=314037 RepID=A0AAE1C850_9PEZI|nr:hypothetical protein B0T22DRAFT_282514 [Podospora appendiculata]